MSLGHEKLDVYRLSINYVAWVFVQADELLFRKSRERTVIKDCDFDSDSDPDYDHSCVHFYE